MAALDDFKQFVADAQAGSQYATWAKQNPGDLSHWQAFRDQVLAGTVPPPPTPTMTTPHGRELVDAAVETEHYVALQGQVDPPPPPPPPPPSGKWAKGGEGLLAWGTIPADVSKYDVVIAADWQIAKLSQIGSAATLYTSGVSCRPSGDAFYGMYAGDLTVSGWQLRDAGGKSVPNKGYPAAIMADVGNAAYQAKWASNVIAYCHTHGIARVEIDDVDTTLSHYAAVVVPEYPNGQGWRNAHISFCTAAATALHAAGIDAYPNISDGSTTGAFALLLKPAKGVCLEDFGNTYGAPVAKQILDGGMDVIATAYAPLAGKEALLRTVDNGRAVYMTPV